MGLTQDEVIGHTSTELRSITNEQRSSFFSELNKSGRVENLEMSVMIKDGELRHGLFNAVMMTIGNEKYLLTVMLDITNRKLAEEALVKSEEKYRQLAKATHDAIIIEDLEGIITYVNSATQELVGDINVVGRPAKDYIPPELISKYNEMMEARRQGHLENISYEWSIISPKDKSIMIFDVKSSLLMDKSKPSGILLVGRDITERKRQEETLRESERKFRRIFESFEDVYCETDLRGSIKLISPSIYPAWGVKPEELIGKPATIFYATPGDRSDLLKALSKCGHVRDYEINIVRPDGSKVMTSLAARLVYDSNGTPIGTAGSFRDITYRKIMEKELRESEARFRMFAENAQDMIYRMSLPDGKYEYVSPASFYLTGFTPEEHYNGTVNINSLIHPDFTSYLNQQWEKLLQGEIPPFYEYKIIHKDGSERWLNQRNFLVRDERGSAIAIEGIVSDVTVSKIEEEKYRLVAETITDCITLVGEHGIITYVVNSLEMFGYNSEELIGTNGLDITHPDDLERIRRIYLEAFEKDWGDITFDMRVRHKNGNYVPMEIRARTLTDPQGKVIGGVFVARDITKRRQTELDS